MVSKEFFRETKNVEFKRKILSNIKNFKYEFEKKYSGITFEDMMKYAVEGEK